MTRAAMHRSFSAFALAGALFAAPAPAAAATCAALPSPVFVSGSSLLQPLIKAMGQALSASATPITLVFQVTDSCTAASAFATNETPLLTGSGLIWDYTGTQNTCELGTGFPSDVGVSELFPATCGTTLADHVSEQLGPVDALAFVVPRSSTATSIDKAAAYMVFGFGAQSAPLIQPWNNFATIWRLPSDSPTQLMLGLGIGVPAAQWRPTSNVQASTIAMLQTLATSANPNSTIGILTSDIADTQRTLVKELAYQEAGQSCAYWPDSTSSAKDKQNVRDGHYPLWGRSHFFFRSSASGDALSANVTKVLELISGTTSVAGVNAVQLEATAGLVPDCAMRVTRSAELAPLESYMPDASCSCYFASLTGGSVATCAPCSSDAQCPGSAPFCHFGYCELK